VSITLTKEVTKMKGKIVWMLMSCLMAAILALASCTPSVTEEEEEVVKPPTEEEEVVKPPVEEEEVVPAGPEMVKLSLKKLDGTKVAKTVEKPQYGGAITLQYWQDPQGFDPTSGLNSVIYNGNIVWENLQTGDWYRSPVGTNEYGFNHFAYVPPIYRRGAIAESWEYTDPLTVVWHIRQGIYWQDVPPVNGREVIADDVVFSIDRQRSSPRISPKYWGVVDTVTATDRYTVVEKLKKSNWFHIDDTGDANCAPIIPKEVVEKYGDLNEWQSLVGSGPWIITDYVHATSANFKRNPNYWMMDPLFPENQLPYADNLKMIWILDLSTRIAALQAAKTDVLCDMDWIAYETISKTSSQIKWKGYPYPGGSVSIMPRCDEPPFDNILVRQALLLAMDDESILEDYLKGYGLLHNYPIMSVWGESLYTPLDELPTEPTIEGSRCGVRELYGYDPDKAKELLAEAGYPDGLTFQCFVGTTEVDVVSLVKAYWDKVGINMQIEVRDEAVKSQLVQALPRQYHGAVQQWAMSAFPFGVWTSEYVTLASRNVGNVSDPYIDKTYAEMAAEPDPDKRSQICKDLSLYALEAAYKVVGPHATKYNFWQPWIKNCEGASDMSFWGRFKGATYYWVDQDLKEEMIGKR